MKVAIIGGGAAGMMTAATINELNPDIEVYLIEKNRILGNKVIISGGGRCNVTTGFKDLRVIMDRYPRGGKFLNSAMHRFSPDKVYDWFEEHGVPLKIEEDLRVFPVSNKGKDIVGVFEKIFENSGTKILFSHDVQKIEKGFKIYFKNDGNLEVDKLVLTTGGQAYRQTGSTGDGYNFAESLGHSITSLSPSLNSFICQEDWTKEVAGVSLNKAKIFTKNQHYTGPFIFTHKGISGPAVFALSAMLAFENYNKEHPLKVFIDLIPDLSFADFESEFKNNLQKNPKKKFINTLAEYIPKSLAEIVTQLLGINDQKINIEIAKLEINKTIESLKRLPLNIVGRGAGDEFVTAGGVELKEVNPKTMESKICHGLYFAGEILNIDGFTGGYNLQASWATGRAAGEAISLIQ